MPYKDKEKKIENIGLRIKIRKKKKIEDTKKLQEEKKLEKFLIIKEELE